MGILDAHGVSSVFHYAPLHYIAFIARSNVLLTKTSLKNRGYPGNHYRSKSNALDAARGFGAYAFLTLAPAPPILEAKLSAGFPHIRLSVPAASVDAVEFHLCRFNVAMTRYLRRDGKAGVAESASNGRYYGNQQIPVARSDADKNAMLSVHLPKKTMLEVLLPRDLALTSDTTVTCYSTPDFDITASVCAQLAPKWAVRLEQKDNYRRKAHYASQIEQFLARAVQDPAWHGNGLEFDRI